MIYIQWAFILGMIFGGLVVIIGYLSGSYIERIFKLKPKKERGKTTIGPMLQETLNRIDKEREGSNG